MDTMKFASNEIAFAVAKEAVWLAWNACGGPMGFGFFRDAPGSDKEAVWNQAYNNLDYAVRHGGPEEVNCDYVFGRMMKLRFTVEDGVLTFGDYEPRGDYQSWCHRYKTFRALFDAAAESVGAAPEKQAA